MERFTTKGSMMENINKSKIIFFILFVLIFSYITTGILVFFLNGFFSVNIFKMINNQYDLLFTYKALVNSYPKAYEALAYTISFFSFIGLFLILIPNKKSLHGNAKFASTSEIKKLGLLNDNGLILGKLENGKLLKWQSSEFLALGAPTRSGKGVAIVIPNLMEWKESCVVLDIKQECFNFSSKYRRDILGQKVYLFNPFDFRTHRYNPLTYIDLTNNMTMDNDLLDFVNLLYPADGDNTTVFFNQQAQNLFIGLAYLYKDLALTAEGKEFLDENNLKVEWSLCGLLNLSAGFDLKIEGENNEEQKISGFDDTFEYLDFLDIVSKETKNRLNSYLTIDSQNTKSGVMSSFNAPLMIYRNEPITTATAASDFDLRDLRKEKTTIYIGITPDKLAISRPILNIFFSQLINVNTKELPQNNPDLIYSCLLLMDEFTSIGNMPILKKGVSYISGYHLRIMMIFQAISQLEAAIPDGYGKDGASTLLQNMGAKIYYTPSEFEEAEKISKRLGDTTVEVKSRSFNHGALLEGGSSSHSLSEQRRALMLPQELIELPSNKALLMLKGSKPIICNKAFYYNDEYFINKFRKISSHMKNIKKPNYKDWEKMIQLNETSIEIPIQKIDK